MMKKILMVTVLCLTLGIAGIAQAFWVGSVFNGDPTVNALVPNVMGFDWSSSGSGVIIGVGPIGTFFPAGTPFTFDFQASLVGLTDPNGQSVTFPGLNSTFEYTLVAQLPEVINTVTPIGGGLFVDTFVNSGGTFTLYYEKPNDNNVAAGTGFDDGTVVATGSFIPGQISSFTLTSPTGGIGSFILEGLVNPGSVNPAFLDPAITIFDFRAEGTLNAPPLDSTTLGFFDGNAYPRYIVNPATDGLLKADASSKFSTIPEPSTMLLMGAGLLGLAGLVRRQTKK